MSNTNIIKEVVRISEIINGGINDLLLETKNPLKLVKLADDFAKIFGIDYFDDILKKFRNGTVAADDVAEMVKNFNWVPFTKKFIRNPDLLGPDWVDLIKQYEKTLINDPKKYSEVIRDLNKIIDNPNYTSSFPDNLKSALKSEVSSIMDGAVKKGKQRQLTKSNYSQAIQKGFNSPDMLKKMVGNVLGRNWPTQKFTRDEYKRLTWWLTTGTSRLPSEIVEVFKKNGFGPGVASFGAEYLRKYFTLFLAMWISKTLYQAVVDQFNTTKEYPDSNLIQAAWARLMKELPNSFPDAKWVVPMTEVWPIASKILEPLFSGESIAQPAMDKVKKSINDVSEQVKGIEDKSKTTTPSNTEPTDNLKSYILSRYPDFKFGNNLRMVDNTPYFYDGEKSYLIYDNGTDYYINYGDEVIFLNDITN